MLKGKWKFFICIALVTCVIFTASNGVFAAINEDYYEATTVVDAYLDSKIKNSSLLSAIGSFIYAVGSLMEMVLGKVFELVTQTNMFPWADQILFNAVPFLDVNIFTGAQGSLVSILYDFLTGTYYSLLTLASTFFGIAVMFSAVKLAITAIAEDKAKYKKAIVDWILGLVILWGMHFFISFVLYLNEQLVVVASNIAIKEIQQSGDKIQELTNSSAYNESLVASFVDVMSSGHFTIRDLVTIVAIVIGVVVVLVFLITGVGAIIEGFAAVTLLPAAFAEATSLTALCANLAYLLPIIGAGLIPAGAIGAGATGAVMGVADAIDIAPALLTMDKAIEDVYDTALKELDVNEELLEKLYNGTWSYSYKDSDGVYQTRSGRTVDVAAALLKNEDYRKYRFPKGIIEDKGFWQWNDVADEKYIKILYLDTMIVCGQEFELKDKKNKDDSGTIVPIELYRASYEAMAKIPAGSQNDDNYDYETYKYSKALCDVQDAQVIKEASKQNIISNLAMYFKDTSFTTSETGWVANRAVVQNAIMYVLLVSYSLVFFISYTKRLFYVIMLILMAPIVVVFDFFMKFGK